MEKRTDEAYWRQFLSSGESLIWVGRPSKQRHFTTGKVISFLCVLCWIALAVGWTVYMFMKNGLLGFFGIPFAALGIVYLFVMAFFRSKTKYALTNKRILCKRGGLYTQAPYEVISNVSRRAFRDGVGDIRFSIRASLSTSQYGNKVHGDSGKLTEIADVEHVYQLILERIQG